MTSVERRDEVVLWLPASPRAAMLLRSRMRAFLALPPAAQASVGLVVTELVAAAIAHLDEDESKRFEVRLERLPGRARIAVEHGAGPQASGRFAREPEVEDLSDRLLDGLSLARGVEGTTAWVVVDRP